MTKDNRYNGWTNYETWTVPLLIDNEEGSSRYWQEITQEIYEDTIENGGDEEDAIMSLADRLKEEIEDGAPVIPMMYSQLLSGALSEVNWREIAEHWMAEVEKPEPEPDDDDGDLIIDPEAEMEAEDIERS